MSYVIVIELDIWLMSYADWSFCYTHLTYNVFSFSGIWFILYLVSNTSQLQSGDVDVSDVASSRYA
jgi:hypothetical protein